MRPQGRTRWTFKLLADKAVALEIVDTISECVRTTLKNALKPWQQHQWVIPPQANAAFVCAMEDAGSVHTPLRSTASPGVPGRDQQQLVADTRDPSPRRRGSQSGSIMSTSGRARPICL